MNGGEQIMPIVHYHEEFELVDKKNKKQEDEDSEQAQEQGHLQLLSADCQDQTETNSMPLLPVATCSDNGKHEMRVAADESAGASAETSTTKGKKKVEATQESRQRFSSSRRHSWGDCAPHVVLLREALLSSAPDIAVLGPLHGCFAFYMAHLHNEVLSSSYARTMTLGPNMTRLESAFMWVGGWRPTSALVLVYSLMGIDIEDALKAARAGLNVGERSTSSVLSSRQLAVMHTLQKHTQHSEMKISKKLTVLQMLIGDQDMLEAVLLDAASPIVNDSSRFDQVTQKRMSRFRRILVQAEELRLHTVKDLLSLLTPIQAARCGVAVFEMCSSLRTMGTTLPLRLPTLARSSLPLVTTPRSPGLLSSPAVDKPLVVASCGEIAVSDFSSTKVLSSSLCPLYRIHEPLLLSNLSSANIILNSSNTLVGQSHTQPLLSGVTSSSEMLHASDVLLRQSDETELLVPSCSNKFSSLQLLAEDSSRGSQKEERSRILSTTGPSLLNLKLDDVTSDGLGPTTVEQFPRVGNSEEREIISNRLLLLSPASSDVVIQSCSLETTELGPAFELRPALPRISDDTEETSHQAQFESSASGDVGRSWHTQQCSMPMSILWKWSSARNLRCYLRRKFAQWYCDWMGMLWRESF